MRLDIFLVQNNFFSSREKARLAIEQGAVQVNNGIMQKAAAEVGEDALVTIITETMPYVSKGGLKLAKALQEFEVDLAGKRILDLGASTGGFTDCVLQHGAAKVYAVDVGTGQLHDKLRSDDRVSVYEGLHLRNLTLQQLDNQPVDALVMDLSFISLTHVFPVIAPFLQPEALVIPLIKPQFELGERLKLKGGIVRDTKIHQKVIQKVTIAAETAGFQLHKLTTTDVENPDKKNIEFLGLFTRKMA